MRISIIICTRNRAGALLDTLNSLARVEAPAGAEIEVLVIDNGSTDATKDVVLGHEIFERRPRYSFERRSGKSQALNLGLSQATGDIIVLTDDDIRPFPGWLEELTRPIVAARCDAVAGSVEIAAHLRRPWMRAIHTGWLAATDYLDQSSPEAAVGANMAFHRKVLSRVSQFDPDLGPGKLGLWEDTLFALQLKRAGFSLQMALAARVEHHFEAIRLRREAFLQRAKAEGRSSAYVAWHWQHVSSPAPLRSIARYYSHLLAKRLTRWSQWHTNEGMPEWEINLLTGIEFKRHCLRLRRTTRLYAKFGLQRLDYRSPPSLQHQSC